MSCPNCVLIVCFPRWCKRICCSSRNTEAKLLSQFKQWNGLCWCFILMCALNELVQENRSEQKLQQCTIRSECVCMCFFSDWALLNARWHSVHCFVFSRVCVRLCSFRLDAVANALPQTSHSNVFSPVCARRCALSDSFVTNWRKQFAWVQTKCLSDEWMCWMCDFNSPLVMYRVPHTVHSWFFSPRWIFMCT